MRGVLEFTPGAGAGIPLSRAAEIILNMTGGVVPGADEPRVRRAALYLGVAPEDLVSACEDRAILRELKEAGWR